MSETPRPGEPQPDPYGQPPAGGPPPAGEPQPDPYGEPPAGGPPPAGEPQQPSGPPPAQGRPPEWGQQPPPYGGQPPAYEQQPPVQGQQPPAYGQPAYGQQSPYGQQPGWETPGAGPGTPVGTPASMLARLGARVIDVLILSIPAFLVFLALGGSFAGRVEVDPVTGELTNPEDFAALLAGLVLFAGLFALLSVLYEVGFIAVKGATPGKMALNIKVVDEAGAGLIGWGRSFVRWIVPFVGSLVCGIGQWVVYLSPFFDGTGRLQGWHDKAARDLVVKAK